MAPIDGQDTPEGIFSLLDTDLYKLTMQCAVLKYFPDTPVSYQFTNRTPEKRLTKKAYTWLQEQIDKLENIRVTYEEIAWLKKTCPYLTTEYLEFLRTFRLHPSEQVKLSFTSVKTGDVSEDHPGDIDLSVHGVWKDTILYEIPLLALTSEAYFKFVDTAWSHEGQVENAKRKGERLIEAGCVFSEFGSRRRRDYKTHEMVMDGLIEAQKESESNGKDWKGKWTGTSNVHMAMKYGVNPSGTVAHEWFMGIAAITQDYANANEAAMQYWTGTFGRGVLAIALTDTFGTPSFLRAFSRPAPQSGETDNIHGNEPNYAHIFSGVRQDSGDPVEYIKMMRKYYDSQGIKDKKIIVFSDSLNIDRCIQYKEATEAAGLTPSFGVGTFFTNDFKNLSTNEKSVPLNIVIKLSRANGRYAIKLSDDKGKNMGNEEFMRSVKEAVGYNEKIWEGGNEAHRWDKNDG
ncbi:Nicotinate phosphoribosyltransferase [Fulvia fulva]|uniref:Nicotinate phosphoribosyltransferase n=1 Tax=Passalora fulva TaxID=5499 RepID=A0A9Q8P4A7_PASFU|nr:Nicotinate phosphoribosyltransferase [Fulvia fulva]KAK4634981.1 Nicotinate phosphoribosyltransferase [Fulvia fulva]KAK4637555.1 Nicotinate phosphoribosyltransferase [Fulvia fulva]UJO12542.1 Nicotinate phosphoribosyltransferase [Fulvia fulva]WPV08203.1 Nicotinate phosphoribosyltransferase [Fulvia fulva]WPV23699.1 Nicotinate phosphoribosyltransferase [Fulvia fulva]